MSVSNMSRWHQVLCHVWTSD